LNPKPHEAQLEDENSQKTQKGHLEAEKAVRPTKVTKAANQGKEPKKSSKSETSTLPLKSTPLTLSMQTLPHS
jgi:hypothetical protein